MRGTRLVLACAVALAIAGCDDEPTGYGSEPVRVYVEDAVTGLPVAGVKIAVMDAHTNLPLALPRVSDADGLCDFSPLRGVVPAVLAFGGERWRMFGGQGHLGWGYAARGDEHHPLAAKTSPVAPPPLIRMVAITPPRGARIAGTIVDAVSGRPLGAAFVGTSRYPTGYDGGTTVSDDVTLADGAFAVAEIPFLEDPAGRPRQVLPLAVSCAGYRPRLWTYAAASGEDIGRITGVEIALEPAGGEATGSLRGRVLRGTEPVPYLTVGLGNADPADKGTVGLVGRTAACDFDGVFVFADLPVGRYVLHPGFRSGDAAWYPDQPANVPHTVAADAETDAGDFQVLWQLVVQEPGNGDTVPRAQRTFRWWSWSGAVAYDVFLDRREPVRVGVTAWSLADGDTLAPGIHVWQVRAYDADDRVVGTFGPNAEFLVRD